MLQKEDMLSMGKPYHDDRTSVGGITKHDYQGIGKSKKPVNKVGIEQEYETEMTKMPIRELPENEEQSPSKIKMQILPKSDPSPAPVGIACRVIVASPRRQRILTSHRRRPLRSSVARARTPLHRARRRSFPCSPRRSWGCRLASIAHSAF